MQKANCSEWKRVRLANGLECYTPRQLNKGEGWAVVAFCVFVCALALLGRLIGGVQ